MRRALILCIGMLSVFGCSTMLNSNLQSAAVATPAALMRADRDFATATHARGMAGWMSFFTRDAIRIPYGRGEIVKGYDAVRHLDEAGIADTTVTLNWEPTDGYVFRGGTIGSTTGRFSVVSRKTADAGKELAHGRYTTMWRLENGRWLVIMDTGYPERPTS
jgi:ketosteroid isomerase-like protein